MRTPIGRPDDLAAQVGDALRRGRRRASRAGSPCRARAPASICCRLKLTVRPVSARELLHPRHLLRGRRGAVAAIWNTPVAELTEHAADAEELVAVGEGAGHGARRRACGGASSATSRSRARRPGSPRARGARMRVDVVGGRRLVRGAALAHHVGAQRAVGHLRAEVDRVRPPLERVEVLGEALPLPLDALVQGRAGDVLHALHQVDQAARAAPGAPARSRRRSCPSRPS